MSPDAERVLLSLARAEEQAKSGESLPLRAIARQVMAGDAESAVRVLGELDILGLLRTDMMGWHYGRLTARGREAARSSHS